MSSSILKGMAPFRSRLCVALDIDNGGAALKIAEQLKDSVGGFKIGPRLVMKYGDSLVSKIAEFGPVFVDCKFFDIPSTMEASVRAVFEAGASICTIHGTCGKEALQRMAKLEEELNQTRPFRIIAVTVLTSWEDSSMPNSYKPVSVGEHVLKIANEVMDSGLRSIVCSPRELDILRPFDIFKLTPGIRFQQHIQQVKNDDQKRTMTPNEALRLGADVLVVGRPILEAMDPVKAAMDLNLQLL